MLANAAAAFGGENNSKNNQAGPMLVATESISNDLALV